MVVLLACGVLWCGHRSHSGSQSSVLLRGGTERERVLIRISSLQLICGESDRSATYSDRQPPAPPFSYPPRRPLLPFSNNSYDIPHDLLAHYPPQPLDTPKIRCQTPSADDARLHLLPLPASDSLGLYVARTLNISNNDFGNVTGRTTIYM